MSCKAKTADHNAHLKVIQGKKGHRYQLHSACGICGKRKARFISHQEAQGSGLITDLIKRFAPQTAPTIDKVQDTIGGIPLVGGILSKII